MLERVMAGPAPGC
jgi:tetratricopeptide (TPR) repeat protein